MSHIFPSYTLGQLNIFNFFLYNFIDNSRKYDWKEWEFSKTMSGKIDPSYFLKNPTLSSHTFLNYLLNCISKN